MAPDPGLRPTGWVRVDLIGDGWTLMAGSFGAAAARIPCGRGEILFFGWVPDPYSNGKQGEGD
jgi:hypothetical protein